jgi:hypothetical protein
MQGMTWIVDRDSVVQARSHREILQGARGALPRYLASVVQAPPVGRLERRRVLGQGVLETRVSRCLGPSGFNARNNRPPSFARRDARRQSDASEQQHQPQRHHQRKATAVFHRPTPITARMGNSSNAGSA